MSLCEYFCVVVEGMYTCKTENFGKQAFVFRFFLYRVCTHVRLRILEAILCVYYCVVVEGIYTCETDNFRYEPL